MPDRKKLRQIWVVEVGRPCRRKFVAAFFDEDEAEKEAIRQKRKDGVLAVEVYGPIPLKEKRS